MIFVQMLPKIYKVFKELEMLLCDKKAMYLMEKCVVNAGQRMIIVPEKKLDIFNTI